MSYAQRHSVYADENNRPEAKGAITKGAGRVPLGSSAANAPGRRALGDIGNLVGGLSRATIVSKDGTKRGLSSQALEKPRTRAAVRAGLAPPPAPQHWGVQKPRTQQAKSSEYGSLVSSSSNSLRSNAAVKATKAVGLGKHAKAGDFMDIVLEDEPKGTTATLAVRSAQACTPLDTDMIEVDDPLPDIDSVDKDDVLCVVEYVEDIYSYYRKVEAQSCVPADYIFRQRDINDRMRAILVDWLIEVHLKFKLMPETLYLTTNIIDRYLSKQAVSRKHLQLVGVTAMLLASKYEEIWAPEVNDFVFISDQAYTREQILAMEKHMLNTLRFDLTLPTPYVFMLRFLKAADADPKLDKCSHFMVELAMVEYHMVRYSPSLLAAAAIHTALKTLDRVSWNVTLQRHTGYAEQDLREASSQMMKFHHRAYTIYTSPKIPDNALVAVLKKYSLPSYYEISKLRPCPEETLGDEFSCS